MNASKSPKTEVTLRDARWGDLKYLWLLRNDPVTRANSFTHDPITWLHHIEWFERTMATIVDHQLLIAESYGFEVGMVRFDYGPDDAKLNWAVSPEFRHQGFGKALVEAAIRIEPKKVLVAWVMPHNKASLKIAESLGFIEESRSFTTIVLTRQPE